MPNCQSTVGQPSGIAIDPASTCVYAGEYSGSGVSEVAAFTLTEDVLGPPNDYKPFGPGVESDGVLVNWDNEALYVSNQYSAHMTIGTIASGCKLTYKTIISDGVSGVDNPGQIAQAQIAHGYVVTGDFSGNIRPHMGIFRANVAGDLTPIGSGQFPLMKGKNGVAPMTVVVVGSE
jgi:DNA-binding beta-propeller fold protein YncE